MSHAGLLGNVGQGNYASAKLGIGALTMVWAREMEKYNVTCNAIVPMARTRMTVQTPSLSAMFGEKPPEGQFDDMAPENVSPLVAYLASDHAQNITGRWLSIRGGKLESWLPPQLAKSIDIDKRWTVKEITERVGELGDLSMPSAGI
jgi:NAD(P)-dependent dehydrogenase (short-subunit alcohol dehydrogenase family)